LKKEMMIKTGTLTTYGIKLSTSSSLSSNPREGLVNKLRVNKTRTSPSNNSVNSQEYLILLKLDNFSKLT
jgi:hypothetical protein